MQVSQREQVAEAALVCRRRLKHSLDDALHTYSCCGLTVCPKARTPDRPQGHKSRIKQLVMSSASNSGEHFELAPYMRAL